MKAISSDKLIPLGLSALASTAITAIAVHALGWLSLYYSARFIVIPAFVCIFAYAFSQPSLGKKIIKGWVFGLIAVSFYDLSRIPFMMMGWGDFIPSIGNWFMGTEHTDPLVGYAWRYIGNGGGLGIAFMLLLHCFNIPGHKILVGTCFGVLVWAGLTCILFLSPHAQSLMFHLTSLSVTGSFIGHFVFGIVLGILVYVDRRKR